MIGETHERPFSGISGPTVTLVSLNFLFSGRAFRALQGMVGTTLNLSRDFLMTNVRVDFGLVQLTFQVSPFLRKGWGLTYSLFLLLKIRKREAWRVGSG
jgi:hypothetical protein